MAAPMRGPRPYATILLAVATTAAWLWAEGSGREAVLTIQAGFVPARVAADLPAGALSHGLPTWLTPLSATLVHGSLMHLFFNMVMFVFVGNFVEAALGSGRFLILYVAGAYLAAAGQWLVGPTSLQPMIGASGAISAIVAAQALIYGTRRPSALGPLSAEFLNVLWLAVAWMALQWLTVKATGLNIATAAHVGGFLAGLILATPLLRWREQRQA